LRPEFDSQGKLERSVDTRQSPDIGMTAGDRRSPSDNHRDSRAIPNGAWPARSFSIQPSASA
jgi:hypothetical protein